MRALSKERLIAAIEANFKDGETIFEDSRILTEIFKQLGDEWYIVDGRWQNVSKEDK